jgi:hypothetical protein
MKVGGGKGRRIFKYRHIKGLGKQYGRRWKQKRDKGKERSDVSHHLDKSCTSQYNVTILNSLFIQR